MPPAAAPCSALHLHFLSCTPSPLSWSLLHFISPVLGLVLSIPLRAFLQVICLSPLSPCFRLEWLGFRSATQLLWKTHSETCIAFMLSYIFSFLNSVSSCSALLCRVRTSWRGFLRKDTRAMIFLSPL